MPCVDVVYDDNALVGVSDVLLRRGRVKGEAEKSRAR
jgi:hypothetical protein